MADINAHDWCNLQGPIWCSWFRRLAALLCFHVLKRLYYSALHRHMPANTNRGHHRYHSNCRLARPIRLSLARKPGKSHSLTPAWTYFHSFPMSFARAPAWISDGPEHGASVTVTSQPRHFPAIDANCDCPPCSSTSTSTACLDTTTHKKHTQRHCANKRRHIRRTHSRPRNLQSLCCVPRHDSCYPASK